MYYPQTTITSKTSTLPVSLGEAKEHLRIATDRLDDDVNAALEAATEYCENVTGRSLRVGHTLQQAYSEWPTDCVRFDRQPVKSVSSVKYYASDDSDTTVSSSLYRLLQSTDGGSLLEWDEDFTFPTTASRGDAVRLTYVAGYSSVDDVPPAAKYAIRLMLQSIYGGELDERQRPAIERSIRNLLGSIEWGFFR